MMLATKVQELWAALDGMVVAESSETFSGHPKHQSPNDTVKNLRHWLFNIQVNLTGHALGWTREGVSRQVAVLEAIARFQLSFDDMVILSDIDEVLTHEAVWALQYCVPSTTDVVILPLQWHSYSLQWTLPFSWMSLVAVRVGAFLCNTKALSQARRVRWSAFRKGSEEGGVHPCVKQVHVLRGETINGWHLSNFLSSRQLAQKLNSFSHTEFNSTMHANANRLRHCLQGGLDYVGRPIMDLLPSQPGIRVPHLFLREPSHFGPLGRDWLPNTRSLRDRNTSWWECHGPLLQLHQG